MTDDSTIINAVLQGDVESFRELVLRYEKPVIRMINNLINDHHSCEDIAQDVFFTAYRKIKSYDSARSSFATWLFTIARNKSINALKKKRPAPANNLPENSAPSAATDTLVQQEFFDQLDNALQNLPPKLKTAFVLAEFEKLPYEQIAQIEGTKKGTVKSRLNRAKQKLRIVLKHFETEKT